MSDYEDWEHWLQALEHADGLSKWEEDFVASINEKLERYGKKMLLSDRQEEILRRIYMEKT